MPLGLWLSIRLVPADVLADCRQRAATASPLARSRTAAVITPTPDALSMLIVWAPMYGLYELGLILARFAPKRRATEVEAG